MFSRYNGFLMSKRQQYGIKFPFSTISDKNTMLDTDMSYGEMVKSELIHCIFTPKGERLRCPEFGTRLIQYIFNPNDTDTWGDVLSEIKEAVSRWIPRCNLDDLQISESSDGVGLIATMSYTVKEENGSVNEYILSTNI